VVVPELAGLVAREKKIKATLVIQGRKTTSGKGLTEGSILQHAIPLTSEKCPR
jgi:hypothetical protein